MKSSSLEVVFFLANPCSLSFTNSSAFPSSEIRLFVSITDTPSPTPLVPLFFVLTCDVSLGCKEQKAVLPGDPGPTPTPIPDPGPHLFLLVDLGESLGSRDSFIPFKLLRLSGFIARMNSSTKIRRFW